jgi:PadR family transcriptional regulator, regulatory protein PadR
MWPQPRSFGGFPAEHRRDGGQPRNFIRPCLLLLLKEAPSYGYELLERLPAFGIGQDHAALYRTLHGLEGDGLVSSGWEGRVKGPPRRRYEVTAEGEAWLDQWAATLRETQNLLSFYLSRYRACGPARQRLQSITSGGDPAGGDC